MSKVSIPKLLEYNSIAAAWIGKDPDNKNTKLAYAIEKFSKNYTKAIKPYTNLIKKASVDIEDAQTDFQKEEKGILIWDIIKDDKGSESRVRAYSKHDKKNLEKKLRSIKDELELAIESLFEESEKTPIEIEPYYIKNLPDLTERELEAFTDIIIEPVPEILK